MVTNSFDWQGHRGCRGLLPENSIPAFLKAIDLNVSTLEMDVAVSQDHKIIVTHEPWMSGNICRTPDSETIDEKMEQQFKIYEMDYSLISSFDCGSLGNPRFPKQKKIATSKPSLIDVFKTCEQYIHENNKQKINYNIEIKSKLEWDNIYTPTPDVFSNLLMNEIKTSAINISRFCLQSFDMRILRHLHSNHPEVILALLVEKSFEDVSPLIDQLGFVPNIFSPHYKLLNQQKVRTAQKLGMKVIPWTVNDENEIQRLMNWGVNGIITDYPNISIQHFKK